MYGDVQMQGLQGAAGQGLYPGRLIQSSAPDTPSASSLNSAMGYQDKLLAELAQEIALLEQRISVFLHPVPPSPANQVGGGQLGGSASALAETVASSNARLMGCLEALRSLTARVDA